jgi:DNA-binding response OmpR family regulator
LRDQTILVLDDDLVLPAMARALTLLGYHALQARSEAEVMAVLRAHPEVQLLITDLRPHGIQGEAVARQARALMPQLKVLFLSCRDRPSRGPCLRKPFTVETLAEKVRAVLVAASGEEGEGDHARRGQQRQAPPQRQRHGHEAHPQRPERQSTG